jgi:hypothetical protein
LGFGPPAVDHLFTYIHYNNLYTKVEINREIDFVVWQTSFTFFRQWQWQQPFDISFIMPPKSKTTKTKKTTKRKWGIKDNQLLLQLFESGEVDSTNKEKPNVEATLEKYFSWNTYKNFSVTFRKKADEYNLSKTLAGARAGTSFVFVLILSVQFV